MPWAIDVMYRFAYWDDGPLANINPNVQRLPISTGT